MRPAEHPKFGTPAAMTAYGCLGTAVALGLYYRDVQTLPGNQSFLSTELLSFIVALMIPPVWVGLGYAKAGLLDWIAGQKIAKAVFPCPVCGYDIRETPHRCPECGTRLRWGVLPR